MERRTFLGLMAGSPLVFGLGELFGQESDKKRPAWFDAALKRMKDKGRLGIVVVVPSEGRDVGEALWNLIDGDHPEAHEIFTGSVFICITTKLAVTCGIWAGTETENRFLLDESGNRLAADTIAKDSFADAAKFSSSFSVFLHGEKQERLKPRAEANRLALTPELKSAFGNLKSEDIAVREDATGLILKNLDSVHDLLVHDRQTVILKRAFEAADPKVAGARLPYGTQFAEWQHGGCGGIIEIPPPDAEEKKKDHPPPPCGLARIEDRKARKFLRFLTK